MTILIGIFAAAVGIETVRAGNEAAEQPLSNGASTLVTATDPQAVIAAAGGPPVPLPFVLYALSARDEDIVIGKRDRESSEPHSTEDF